MTRSSRRARSLVLAGLVCAAFACCSRTPPANKAGTGGASGGGVSTAAGAGGAGAAGMTGSVGNGCTAEANVPAPNPTAGCAVAVPPIDPTATCPIAPCPITKILDVDCASRPEGPWLSATSDGAVLLFTNKLDTLEARARLLTVTASDYRVEDVPALADPNVVLAYYSIQNSALAISSSGARWLFAGQAPGITVLHSNAAGWARTRIPSSGERILLDAKMVDDRLGHIAYHERGVWMPHVMSWDGSCWTDRFIGDVRAGTVVVDTDAQKRLWVGWASYDASGTRALHLRHPDGQSRSLDVTGDAPVDGAPLRLLPGGLDGMADSPALLARFKNGIRILSEDPATSSGWRSSTVPESQSPYTGTDDCPSIVPTFDPVPDLCDGKTTCTSQSSGTATGFGLARTRSGAVFASWMEYASEGSYALAVGCSGELVQCACERSQLRGSGTAKLVLARLTGAAPTLTRFAFPMSSAMEYLHVDLAMVARGETLVVAANRGGDLSPTMTYLEIDSQRLP